jgi:hypothetical protein
VLNYSQEKTFGKVVDGVSITVTIRHDDSCGNGHNSFSVTATGYTAGKPKTDSNFLFGGCAHDEVVKYFPELAKYIKWHLCSTDGPMHYTANTLWLAGDRDCFGKKKGEPHQFETHLRFKGFPITFKKFDKKFLEFLKEAYLVAFRDGLAATSYKGYDIVEVPYVKRNATDSNYAFRPKYTLSGYPVEWHQCPFDEKISAEEFLQALTKFGPEFVVVPTAWGDGKAPELEAARHAAVWPDATLEQLQDRQALLDRLPALMAEFKADVESLRFVY